MPPTTEIQEQNEYGINYFWRRQSQISPLTWIGWMRISQTVKSYAYRACLLATLSSVFEKSAGGMLVQDLIPFTLSFWPLLFGHCILSLVLLSCQVGIVFVRAYCNFTHGELLHKRKWSSILGCFW